MTLEQQIDYYTAVRGNNQYVNYIRSIDQHNGGQTADWINNVIRSKGTIQDAIIYFDNYFSNYPKLKAKSISDYKSGFISFTEVILGLFSANTWLTRGRNTGTILSLCQLIADNAIFASKDVVDMVRQGLLGTSDNTSNGGNEYASWDYMLRKRDTGHKKGTIIPDNSPEYQILYNQYPLISPSFKTDDNTYANRAIKNAVKISFEQRFGASNIPVDCFKGYEACHIWDLPGDRRYYASIANLVLIPRCLAALTDHFQDVKDLLRKEAFNRFGFVPDGEAVSACKHYNKITWRYSF